MYTTLFPICLYSEETLTHLFLLFPLAEEVWNNSDLAIHFVDDPLFEFKKWLRDKIIYFRKEDGYNDTRLIHFLDILRAIWTTRNAHVFRHCRATLDVFKENLDQGMHSQATFSFQVVQPQLDNPKHSLSSRVPCCKIREEVRILAQRSLSRPMAHGTITQVGGATWVAMDAYGIRDKLGISFHVSSALATKAKACLQALTWA